ncbi:DUF1684 domain-containing protein [Leucobacter weissii]|uniref:DUF1684 domain-containing protein n=1 Tax=Leucobacter weissii TaxID=1983706 RepID=A0A939MP57_9MICO|nr:DUF1684 domain-containing protein [Leucobacter weissii]MBO1902387.1 DUF1684 domain-containing protein [Leucobacter weissii]
MTASDAWERWRADRLADLNALLGDATLVSTTWLGEGWVPLPDAPGEWRIDAAGRIRHRPGLAAARFDPSAEAPPADEPEDAGLVLPGTFTARFDGRAVTPVRWPGIGSALRVWDAAAGDVARVDAFSYDPEWRLSGAFSPERAGLDYEYLGHGGRVERRETVGRALISIGGEEYRIVVTEGARGFETVFADATNGAETYARGRFAPVELDAEGRAVIDFNRAFLPPCAFSDAFDCPLAPPQNRITVPVRAGETAVVRG